MSFMHAVIHIFFTFPLFCVIENLRKVLKATEAGCRHQLLQLKWLKRDYIFHSVYQKQVERGITFYENIQNLQKILKNLPLTIQGS